MPLLYDALQALVRADACREYFVRKHVRPENGQRVLDVGCGTAQVLKWLPPDVQYVGIDINADYIATAQRTYQRRGEFLVGTSNSAELLRRGPFDIVLAMFLMHHLSDSELNAFLRDVHRLLKPSGRFVSIDPCRVSEAGALERWMMDTDRGGFVRTPEAYKAQVQNVFRDVRLHVTSHLLRIRYSHAILEAEASSNP